MPDGSNVRPSNIEVKPEYGIAERHIELLTGSADTPICFRVISQPDGRGETSARKINGTLADRWTELAELNREGWQIYLVVNEGGHNSAAIKRIRALFIDGDGIPLPETWHVEPSFLLHRDATHWHAYWPVDDTPVEQFSEAQRRLIAHYGTDPGIHDLPRIMRLGGSLHLKDPLNPILCTIEEHAACWAPTYSLAELMEGLPKIASHDPPKTDASKNQLAEDPLDLAAAVAVLANPNLDWDEWNTIGMAIHAATDGSEIGRALWLAFSAKSSKSDETDTLARWEHYSSSPATTIGAGKLYALAKEACPYFERPSHRRKPNEEVFADVDIPPPENELFATGKDRFLRNPPPIEELIPGLIEKHCVAYLSGPGGLSKSRVAFHWGACIHTGTPVYSRQVERATFVHVSYENGVDEDSRRHHTLLRRLEIATEALHDYVACDWKGRGPLLDISEAGEIAPTPLWGALEKRLLAIAGHKFIVFDSAYNVFSFRGNAKINETAVQRSIDWLDNQMARLDATGLMLMHPSTAGIARGDNSGWSVAWTNRPRVRLSFKPVDGRDDIVELSVPKRNNGPKGRPIMLHWHDGLLTPDVDATEQRAIYKAVIEIAKAAANGGRMLKKGTTAKQSGVDHATVDAVEHWCGIRVGLSEIHRMLARAEHDGFLVYQEYNKNQRGEDARAGYRPGSKDIDAPWDAGAGP
jgi:hypothetical protein